MNLRAYPNDKNTFGYSYLLLLLASEFFFYLRWKTAQHESNPKGPQPSGCFESLLHHVSQIWSNALEVCPDPTFTFCIQPYPEELVSIDSTHRLAFDLLSYPKVVQRIKGKDVLFNISASLQYKGFWLLAFACLCQFEAVMSFAVQQEVQY